MFVKYDVILRDTAALWPFFRLPRRRDRIRGASVAGQQSAPANNSRRPMVGAYYTIRPGAGAGPPLKGWMVVTPGC